MKTLDTAEERQLLDSIKKAVDLVESGGMSPDAAIEKVARAGGLTPGKVRIVCAAYNTGRQTSQREAATGVLDKLAAFPLADAGAVIASIYGGASDAEKRASAAVSDEYSRPPDWVGRAAREKAAAADLPRTPPPDYPRDRLHDVHRAYGDVSRVKRAADDARRAHAAAEDTLRHHVAGLVEYFRKAARDRLDFAAVEKAAATYLGPATKPLFDLVHARAGLRREKRATDATDVSAPVDMRRDPMSLVVDCVQAAEAVNRAKAASDALAGRASAARTEVLRPFGKSDTSKSERAAPTPTGEKSASLLTMSALGTGATLGGMLQRGIGGMPKAKDDLIDDAWMDLEDPEHQNEIRKIKAHAMLNTMMTDPDDPISGHDPDQILRAYNEIAQLSPRVAEQPAAIGPLLRRRLAGNVEPFEAKEMTDLEKNITQTRTNTPNSSILSNGPDQLLG